MGRKVGADIQTGFAHGFWPEKNKVGFRHQNISEPLDPETEVRWQLFTGEN